MNNGNNRNAELDSYSNENNQAFQHKYDINNQNNVINNYNLGLGPIPNPHLYSNQ